jgi:glycosyltransferase involved in cell wall biosynthesis
MPGLRPTKWSENSAYILIPVFNDRPGLDRSLASLAQDGSRFDPFVSTTGATLRCYPTEPAIKVYLIRQEPNQGITAALNAGLADTIILAASISAI